MPARARSGLLAGVSLPLGHLDAWFRLEEQPDLDRLPAAHETEGLPGVRLVAERGGPREGLPRRRHPPEPREGDGLNPGLGRVRCRAEEEAARAESDPEARCSRPDDAPPTNCLKGNGHSRYARRAPS